MHGGRTEYARFQATILALDTQTPHGLEIIGSGGWVNVNVRRQESGRNDEHELRETSVFGCYANRQAWRWKDLIKTIPLLVVYLKCVCW